MAKYTRQLSRDVEIYNEKKCYNGYTLFAPSFQNTTAWLVDMYGDVVHHWEMSNPPGLNYKLLPNGHLLWMGRGRNAIEKVNGSADELVEVDWDGNEVWRYDDPMMNHDFVVQENGNIMVLRFVDLPGDLQRRLKGGVPGTELDGKTYGVQVREIDRKGETLWEWNNFEHMDPEKDLECLWCDREVWGYTNSLDVFPNGDVILSVRRMNKVIRIDKKTGRIIWEWGPEHLLGHQHDVSVCDHGNITIFDNGLHRRIHNPQTDHKDSACFLASRALEVNPDTGEIVWQYVDPMHLMISNFCGSTQKLPNGNHLICYSSAGTFWEVTPDKEVVWKYTSPFVLDIPNHFGWTLTRLMFQAHRYGNEYPGLQGKDLDPDKYEWIISRRTSESLDEEARIKRRLELAGY
jgi:outer membrane protein assembly factor BamB